MFVLRMSPHVAFGVLPGVRHITMEAFDREIYFSLSVCSIFPCLGNMEVIERAWGLVFEAGIRSGVVLQTGLDFIVSLVWYH